MKLHELETYEGTTKRRKRVGHGPGSGLGKTSGRGQKGQKSRSGAKLIQYLKVDKVHCSEDYIKEDSQMELSKFVTLLSMLAI